MKENNIKPDNEYEIDITPDVSLFEKLGHGQHEIENAIAELIDNSVDARTKEQEAGTEPLKVNINAPLTAKRKDNSLKYAEYIEIEDNASGMDKSTAESSLIIAKTNREGQKLGRFGLGIKQSCLSIGKRFTITTKAVNSNKRYILEYDNDNFIKSNSWKGFILKEIIDTSTWHGTIIRISDFWNKDLIYYNVLDIKLLRIFSYTFGPFIQNNQLELYINSGSKIKKVEARDLKADCDKDLLLDINIPLKTKLPSGKNVKVYGWAGFLKKTGSTQGFTGFNLYRNFRLIKTWEHIGYKFHAELRKLVGELHLNDFPVTIDKKDFIKDSPQWIELVGERKVDPRGYPLGEYEGGKLAQFVKPLIRKYVSKDKAKRKHGKMEKAIQEKEQALEALEQLEKKQVDSELKKAIVESLKGTKSGISGEKDEAKNLQNAEDEINKKEQQRLGLWRQLVYNTFLDDKKIKINNIIYSFDLKTEHAFQSNNWYRYIIRDQKILIVMNLDFEFILELKKDFDVYAKIITLMGLSEAIVELKKESKEQIRVYLDQLLDIYSKQNKEKREKIELNEDLVTLEKQLKNKEKQEISF